MSGRIESITATLSTSLMLVPLVLFLLEHDAMNSKVIPRQIKTLLLFIIIIVLLKLGRLNLTISEAGTR